MPSITEERKEELRALYKGTTLEIIAKIGTKEIHDDVIAMYRDLATDEKDYLLEYLSLVVAKLMREIYS